MVNGTSTKVSSFNLPNQRGVPGATSILTISIDAAYSAGVATATDNCDETPAITFSDVETPGDCPSEKTITRTWTATDASGNSVSDDQIINIVDTQAPKAPSPPADVSVTCLEDVPEPVDLTAEDNCEDPFTVSPTDVSTPGSNPGEYTIVRTWTFTDACYNTSSVSQTITVADPNGECESCEGLIDTTNVAATTCDPSMVGVMDTVLTNQFGCDSVVITTTTLFPNDTTNVAATTCDPSMVGVMDTVLTNQFGCDSVVITTTTLFPNDTTNVAATTCDPSMVGVMDTVLTNQFGCDSVVITTTTLFPNDTTNVAATTCDPSMVGVMDTVLTNQFGCDSVVITTTTLFPNDTTNVAATTCDPSMVGVMDTVLTNQFGCDSVVITTTTLLPGDICGETCEPTLISEGQPTKTPCDYGNSYSGLGVDGIYGGNTPWTSNPDLVHICQEHEDDWWEVDLRNETVGEQFEISEICIYNRVSNNAGIRNRLSDFYILISCTPFAEDATLDDLLNNPNIYSQYIDETVGYPTCYDIPDVVGSYVRLMKPGRKPLHFGEVQVYGCPSDADCGPQPDPCAHLSQPVIDPAGPFEPTDGPVQLVASPPGGSWIGPGVNSAGMFDPSIGVGSYAVAYRVADGDCEKMETIEIEVIEPGSCNSPYNLAEGKEASQSSTYGRGEASIAVDGDLDGSRGPWNNASIQHTRNENQPWWKVDLGSSADINSIKFYNRTDCCSNRLKDFYVFVSNSPINAFQSMETLLGDPNIHSYYYAGSVGAQQTIEWEVSGRYVAIKLKGNSPLHMAEVQVMGCEAGTGGGDPDPDPVSCLEGGTVENIAPQGSASQSSTRGNGVAGLAIDGNTTGSTPWSNADLQHTNTENNPWWMLDLGGVADLQEVKLYNRSDCCQNRLKDFYVFASETPIDPDQSIEALKAAATAYEYVEGTIGSNKTIDFSGTSGRYIIVKLTARNPLHMAEVEVYGCMGDNSGARFTNANNGVGEAKRIQMEAYPNPYSETFTLKIAGELAEVGKLQLVNTLGQIIERREVSGNEDLVLGKGLAKGVYFIQLREGDQVHQLKVVKVK